MGTARAVSEVAEFPIFWKEEEYEVIGTQNKKISPTPEGDGWSQRETNKLGDQRMGSKPPLRRALLPTRLQKKSAKNPSTAATAREQCAAR